MRSAAPDPDRLLEGLLAALPAGERQERPRALIGELRANLHTPLRVAVVGQIKAGKSSLLNALVGKSLLPTGATETTYNITWLSYGEEEHAEIRWRDDRPSLKIPIEELGTWVSRREAPASLDEVAIVKVYAPLEILRHVELVDTPGLGSTHGRDSLNTAQFLKLAQQASLEEMSQADAVIFVFRRGFHEADVSSLERFHRYAAGRMSPVNAIGVLTQYDLHWPMAADPHQVAQRIAGSLESNLLVRRLVHHIVPVASLLAGRNDAVDLITPLLPRLLALSNERFAELTGSVCRFLDPSVAELSATERQEIYRLLGLYGISRLRALAGRDRLGSAAALAALRAESGIPALHACLVDHFQRNASLIKLNSGLQRVRIIAARLRDGSDADEARAGTIWASMVEEFIDATPEFMRLDLLRMLSGAPADLDDQDIAEILDFASQNRGTAKPAARASIDLRALSARIDYWRAQNNDLLMSGSSSSRIADLMRRLLEHDMEQRMG